MPYSSVYYAILANVRTLLAPFVHSMSNPLLLAPFAVGAPPSLRRLPLKRGTLTKFFFTLSDDQHEGMVPQRAPSTLVLIAIFFTAVSSTL